MAIDLDKITFPTETYHYTHQCKKCKEEVVFVCDRTGHKHYPDFGTCFGTLIATKKVLIKEEESLK